MEELKFNLEPTVDDWCSDDIREECRKKLRDSLLASLNHATYKQVKHVAEVCSGRISVGPLLGSYHRTIIFSGHYSTLSHNGVHKSPGDGIPFNKVQLEHLQYQTIEWLEDKIADGLVFNFVKP